MMKLSTGILLLSLPSTSAWMTVIPAARTETRLMDTRRSFFGAIASTTTFVAGPLIAYADDEVAFAEPSVETAPEQESSVVEVVDDKTADEPENDVLVEVSDTKEEQHEEVTLALDAKIEDSIGAVEAAVEEVSEEAPKEAEATFVAMVDKTKIFQELLDERKSITSDDDMEAFRTKLQERITADSSFVQDFEAFLDDLTSASG